MFIKKLKILAGLFILHSMLWAQGSYSAEGKSELKDILPPTENTVTLVFSTVPKYSLKKIGSDLVLSIERCSNLYEYSSVNINNNYVGKVSVSAKKINGSNGVEVIFGMLNDYSYKVLEREDNLEFVFAKPETANVPAVNQAKVVKQDPKRSTATKKKSASSAAKAKNPDPNIAQKRSLSLSDRLPMEPVSLDFNQADIKDVLRLLSAKSGVNMIYGDDVTGVLTVHLENVPFREAFNTILSIKGLVVQQVGENILRVLKPQTLTEERAKAATFTKVISLNYAEASQVKSNLDAVRQAEGRKGAIEIDQRTNSLIITDTPEGLSSFEKLITDLDTKPKQVIIEAKLIEMNKTDASLLGVSWSGVTGETRFDAQGNYIGDNVLMGYGKDSTGDDLYWGQRSYDPVTNSWVALPGAASPGEGGTGVNLPGNMDASGFSVGYIKDGLLLTAQLNALITNTNAKVLATPKITTINNKQARISITEQVPYTQVTSDQGTVTTETVFADVGIKLDVTPTINADNKITLKIIPEVSKVLSITAAGPAMSKRTADTTVLVPNNETLVIGGLVDESETETEEKVPFFGDLPLLGYLFKKNDTNKQKKELLIFLTPRILTE